MKIKSSPSSVTLFQDNVFLKARKEEKLSDKVFIKLVTDYPFLLARKSFYVLSKERYGDGEVVGISLTKKEAEEEQFQRAQKNQFVYYTRIHNQLFINQEHGK